MRVVAALQRYGAPPGLVDQVRTMATDEFVFFGVPPARLDLLCSISGVDFAQAWARRTTVVWNGVEVYVIAFDDLVDRPRFRRVSEPV